MARFAPHITLGLLFTVLVTGACVVAPQVAVAATLQLEIVDQADEDVWFEFSPDDFIWDSDLEVLDGALVQGEDEGTSFLMALRFRNVTIPQGATISSAELELAVVTTPPEATFGVLYGHDTDDAPVWGGATTPDNMAKTAASAALIESDVSGVIHAIDVTTIVQEIISRGGWSSGNDIAFAGDASGTTGVIGYESFENAGTITLNIEYTEGGGGEASWYNSSWPYRVQLTIDDAQVDDDLVNFPVYVALEDFPAEFHANVNADGGDIRVTTSDGETELPREVVYYADDFGELHFNADVLSDSSDTVFYVYYGNAAASDYAADDTYGAEAVWLADGHYAGVYHLNNDLLSMTDSTGAQDGTNSGAESDPGGIGAGSAIFNSSDYIDLGQTGLHLNPITVSAWINPSSTGGSQKQIVSKGYDGTNTEWQLITNTDSTVSFNSFANPNVNGATSAGTVSNDTLYYTVGVYDGTTWRVYLDSVADGTSVDTGPASTNQKIAIGGVFSSGSITQNWRGKIDEVRISDVVRSAEWISTEYNNQSDTTSFYAVGAQEEDEGGGGGEEAPARIIRLKGNVRLQGVRLF